MIIRALRVGNWTFRTLVGSLAPMVEPLAEVLLLIKTLIIAAQYFTILISGPIYQRLYVHDRVFFVLGYWGRQVRFSFYQPCNKL